MDAKNAVMKEEKKPDVFIFFPCTRNFSGYYGIDNLEARNIFECLVVSINLMGSASISS